jgi:DNA (cytosine-5)-methyltransferase 1
LQPKTIERIAAGLRRYAHPILVPSDGTWNDAARPVDAPMRSRTTRETEAVVTPPPVPPAADLPPFVMPQRSGRPRTTPISDPLATIVGRGTHHPLVVPLRNNGVARPAGRHPLVTVAAGGTHQGLVMRNNTARGDQGQMSTPLTQPLRALLAEQVQSLIRRDHVLFPYDGRQLRPVDLPMPAQTTVQGDALLGAAPAVDDCTFRMLTVDEIRAGMAFTAGYRLLGTKRERVRMLGNAVTPPAARDLIAAVAEAITGEPIDPAPWPPHHPHQGDTA